MHDIETAADIAGAAVDLAVKLRGAQPWEHLPPAGE
jgi:hypothetical protein